MVRVAF